MVVRRVAAEAPWAAVAARWAAAAGSVGGGSGGGGGSTSDGGTDAGCPRVPGPVDATRFVVASHPFPNDGGSKDNQYEVFSLSPTGTLAATGQFFRMGRASLPDQPIVFTPDGRVGIASQEQGSLGVFRIDEAGAVTVVHTQLTGNFYAGKVLISASGDKVYITDSNTLANGGGVYSMDIGCDGTLSNEQLVLAGDFAAAAAWFSGRTQLAVASRSLGASATMQDLHLADVSGATASVLASATGFPDRDAIAAYISVSADDRWVAVPDNGFAAGSRIAMFERTGTTLTGRQVVSTPNPTAVAFSPFGTVGLVVNTDGMDNYRRLDFNGTSFTVSAPLSYVHGRPQLPGAPVMIARGQLNGRLLIAELDAVRQLQFQPDGGITDVAKTPAGGTGNGQILGTLGVTP